MKSVRLICSFAVFISALLPAQSNPAQSVTRPNERIADASGYEVLFSFGSTFDTGVQPKGGLIEDAGGNLYGTTVAGGTGDNLGTVFKVDQTGQETVLWSFCSHPYCTDGSEPLAGLIRDATATCTALPLMEVGVQRARCSSWTLRVTKQSSIAFNGQTEMGFTPNLV